MNHPSNISTGSTTLNQGEIKDAASVLLQATQSRKWIDSLPAKLSPTSFDDAYAIQETCAQLSGRRPAGWKIGCTSTEIQQLLGSDRPIVGRLFGDTIYQSPITVSKYRTDMALIEAEFAFLIGKDLAPITTDYDLATIKQAVESVIPAIEIVHERYTHWKESPLFEKIADNSGHGSLIIGKPCSVEQAGDLKNKNVNIQLGNSSLATGKGNRVLDDPYNALVWLANMLSHRGLGLRAGDIVTSGSCSGITDIPLGKKIITTFEGLGEIEFEFSDASL